MTPNEINVPKIEEPTDGSPWIDDDGQVWSRAESGRWVTNGQIFNAQTWPGLLVRAGRLRRLVPADEMQVDHVPAYERMRKLAENLEAQVRCLQAEQQVPPTPSPALSTDGDGLDLVTHLREECRTLRDDYDALRGQLASILGLSTSDDDEIVSAVRHLQEHR